MWRPEVGVETGDGCGDRRWVWRPKVGVETGGRCEDWR